MKKKKCLLFFRVSTTKQEWESQLKETKHYAETLGFNDFVTVGKAKGILCRTIRHKTGQ